MLDVLWLIPALPLAGFLLILLFGRRLGDPKAGWLATLMCGGAFVVCVGVFFDLLSKSADERTHVEKIYSWVPVGSLHVDLSLLADPLSVAMILFVTGVGTLIHLYAIGYMHGDPKFSKFFLYLNLFAFSMLMLVLGENMLVTFLGWEGVGTCSYLLISFWHTRDSAATAGKKAFITNRVGDWGFMVAMFFTFQAVGTLSYVSLNGAAEAGSLAKSTATVIALMLFVGAVGKSAQLPLYVWLPDAMEGPTPVSALIHAATMVTAGVYLMRAISPAAVARHLQLVADADRLHRRGDGAVRGDDRGRPERHQEGARLLDREPARLHVPGRRLGRLRRGDLPHDHPRLLQGAAVPRVRLGHPRHARRAGHAPHGRAAQVAAGHRGDVHRRLAGDRRRAAVRRLLEQGRDPASAPGTSRRRCGRSASSPRSSPRST